jgi:hypothetical protein
LKSNDQKKRKGLFLQSLTTITPARLVTKLIPADHTNNGLSHVLKKLSLAKEMCKSKVE